MTQKLHKSKGTKLNMPQFILISISKLFSASQCSGLLPVTGNEEFFFFFLKSALALLMINIPITKSVLQSDEKSSN